MRLLFLANFFPPHSPSYSVGGYERLCADVRDGLRARGHHVDVLTSRHRAPNHPLEDSDGVHRTLHLEVTLQPWFGTLGFFAGRRPRARADAMRLGEAVTATHPDALLVWGMWNIPRSILSLAERWRVPPVVYYVADYWPTLPDAYTLHWRAPAARRWTRAAKAALAAAVERLSPPAAQSALSFRHAACVSAAVRTRLVGAGLPFDRAEVIHNGVDVERFPYRPRRPDGTSGALRVGYAGRLTEDKGVGVLLDALAMIGGRGGSMHLTLAGVAPDAAAATALARTIDALGLRDRVTLCGQVPTERMPALLADLDVLAVPSLWAEPLARVAQEAMASGTVVVATPVGGMPEIVTDGVNGLLCPAGNPAALAACLERLRSDGDLRTRLALAGRQTVEARFDLRATVDGIERFLERVVAAAADGAGPVRASSE